MNTIVVDCRMIRSSGIGTYLRSVLGRLISLNSKKFVLLGKIAEIAQWLHEEKLEATVVNCEAPIYGIREQWQLWRAIPHKCDLYWAPHYVIPVFYQGKMLVTIHDLGHLVRAEAGFIGHAYARLMLSMVKQKATRIITVSEFTKHQLVQYVKVRESNIEVIHNGVPGISNIDTCKGYVDKPYILFVGNVKPHKNLRRIIEAHDMIYKTIKKPLLIVGKKSGFITGDNTIDHIVKTLPDNQVIFTGHVTDQNLATFYRRANMLVFASLYEGFGFPPLEAMSYGVPVLASMVASVPEVCGPAALYCDPYSVEDIAEKMLLLSEDFNLRESLIRMGLRQINKFSLGETAAKHHQMINNILGKG